MNKEETKTIADFLANCYLDQQRLNKILFSKIGYKNTDKIFRILGYIYYNNDEHTILGKDLTLYLETSPAATSQKSSSQTDELSIRGAALTLYSGNNTSARRKKTKNPK